MSANLKNSEPIERVDSSECIFFCNFLPSFRAPLPVCPCAVRELADRLSPCTLCFCKYVLSSYRPHIVQRKHPAVRDHGHVSDHTYLYLQSKSCQSSVVSRRLLRFCNDSTRTEETFPSSGGSSMTSHARGKIEPNDICSTVVPFDLERNALKHFMGVSSTS